MKNREKFVNYHRHLNKWYFTLRDGNGRFQSKGYERHGAAVRESKKYVAKKQLENVKFVECR